MAAYWLHMLATVGWIGSLAGMSLVVLPAARRALEPAAFSALLASAQARLQPVAWFSLLVLGGTGLFQMSAHPSYTGFLAISNSWAAAILAKHLVIGLMVLTSAYLTWWLLPALQRAALLRAAGGQADPAQAARLERQETLLLQVNLFLSVAVLALTAWARTAG
jgi:uncharacterized membrane protein